MSNDAASSSPSLGAPVTGTHRVAARGEAACAGREAELARLTALYRDVQRDGGERLVLLEGPGGIGKSRILAELRSRVRLQGGVVLEGRCEPGRAFGPFADIVDRALRFLDEVGVAPTIDLSGLACRGGCHRLWHLHGADSTALSADPQGATPETAAFERRLRFFDAINALLTEVAAVRAPVVVLHHLEKADQGTLELLSFLLDGAGVVAPQGPSLRALFVGSVRTDASAAGALSELRASERATTLRVGTLDVEGIRAYLQSPEALARVLARTGGMPEAIDLLLEGDPLTPEERLVRRLGSLTAPGRALLEALAVLGRPADIDELARIAGLDVDAASRASFAACDLLTRSIVDGRILFCFERDGDASRAYDALRPEQRRALHGRCARACADSVDPHEAVRHALAAGEHALAAESAAVAAASLSARHAHGEAAALLEGLIQAHAGPVPDAILEQLADLHRVTGDYRAALRHARVIFERHPLDPDAARRVGHLLTVAGEHEEAAVVLTSARALAARGSASVRAEVEAQLAELHYQRAAYAEAEACAQRALATAQAAEDLVIEIHARNTLGKLALAQKDPASAAELFQENREKAAWAGLGHQEAQAHTNLGVALLLSRDLDAAEAACRLAIEVASRASDTRDRAIATENLAVIAHLARDYAKALGYYHDAVGLLKRLGNRAMLARVANNLGELYHSLGERGRARSLCEFAAHVGGTALPRSVVGEGLLLRGRVEAADGNVVAARAAFDQARATLVKLGSPLAVAAALELARLALWDGDVSAARALLAELGEPETPKRAAEIALVAADVERAAGADTLAAARRAVELAELANDEELLLPALVRHARALGDAGEVGLATRVLERAQRIEEALSSRVPEESRGSWAERRARAELTQAAAALASAWTATRHESVPPPKALSAARQGSPERNDDRQLRWRRRYPELVGSAPAMTSVFGVLDNVAASDALVLVRGESGTGKELIADAIHRNSPRRGKPLVKVNCAALVETLLLSELFGHERGAFTGANARKKGRFELADGGTIFLDEIGDISPKTQVALLRVLQEREIDRVGGTQPIKVDVRIVAATHRDLEQMVRDGTFREDLYYRLRGVTIDMPALRQRLADLPVLCDALLARIAEERGETPKRLSPEAAALLGRHRWPGNVRELENVLRSATLFADGPILVPDDFMAFAESFTPVEPEAPTSSGGLRAVEPAGAPTPVELLAYERIREGETSLFEMKKRMERECIVRALDETDGNITRAATLLGMKRPRLSQLVKQYGLAKGVEE